MDEAMDHSDHPAYLMQLFDGTVRDDVARGIDDGIRYAGHAFGAPLTPEPLPPQRA
jgi:hypothetical protein